MQIDRNKLRDGKGHPLTQSLFLECGYQTEFAMYTLKDDDHEYEGKLYPSIKRLYLKEEDPVEYDFANKYFLGWNHWLRLYDNKLLTSHIDSWRNELELKLRSMAVKGILDMTASEQPFQALKWLHDKGWAPKGVGRPTTKEKQKEDSFRKSMENDYVQDIARLKVIQGNKE